MLAPERQGRIAQLMQQRASMSVQELSRQFGVSLMTIRRDLDALEEKGLIVRIHGGAMAPASPVASREEVRSTWHVEEKVAIAALAATLVEDGQTLFIDAGTTTIELARQLRERRGLTVVTNSVRVLAALADSPGINLIGLGGSVYGGAWSFVGPLAEAALRRFNAGAAFMGITSVSLEQGLTEVNFFEAAIKSLMIQRAQRVVLLADHSKFGKVSPVSVASVKEVHAIITDERLPAEVVAVYREVGVEMVIARLAEAGSPCPTCGVR
ncbi:MAG: DeoR/GlpR family DNA-binding transcription regulator [Anaerolineae bacterium]|nr:DeoR/GlpR family DNA-binding transcription regulator [Anaerolineae bacterium]